MSSWLLCWPGALGFYLQLITLLHYDNFLLEFVVFLPSIHHNSSQSISLLSVSRLILVSQNGGQKLAEYFLFFDKRTIPLA